MKKIKRGSEKLILKGNKRGQFFIIVAVIIILLLYTLTINYNYIRESVSLQDYAELRNNYNAESPKVLNNAIFLTTDPTKCKGASPDPNCPIQAVQDFAKNYQQYANQKDPSFGLVSVIRDPVSGDLIIQNLLAGGKYIKIRTKDYKGDSVKLLWSSTATSGGTITLNGIGSLSTSTPVSAFSESLTSATVKSGAVDFKIVLDDGSEIPINTRNDNLAQTIISDNNGKGTIDVDVCPEGPRC